jgi:hypothetical protein
LAEEVCSRRQSSVLEYPSRERRDAYVSRDVREAVPVLGVDSKGNGRLEITDYEPGEQRVDCRAAGPRRASHLVSDPYDSLTIADAAEQRRLFFVSHRSSVLAQLRRVRDASHEQRSEVASRESDAGDRDERPWFDADQHPLPVLYVVGCAGSDGGVDVLAADPGRPLVSIVWCYHGIALDADLLVWSLSVLAKGCLHVDHESYARVGSSPGDVTAVRVARHHDRSAVKNKPERRDVGITVAVNRCQTQRDGRGKQVLDLRRLEAARHNAIMPP